MITLQTEALQHLDEVCLCIFWLHLSSAGFAFPKFSNRSTVGLGEDTSDVSTSLDEHCGLDWSASRFYFLLPFAFSLWLFNVEVAYWL